MTKLNLIIFQLSKISDWVKSLSTNIDSTPVLLECGSAQIQAEKYHFSLIFCHWFSFKIFSLGFFWSIKFLNNMCLITHHFQRQQNWRIYSTVLANYFYFRFIVKTNHFIYNFLTTILIIFFSDEYVFGSDGPWCFFNLLLKYIYIYLFRMAFNTH